MGDSAVIIGIPENLNIRERVQELIKENSEEFSEWFDIYDDKEFIEKMTCDIEKFQKGEFFIPDYADYCLFRFLNFLDCFIESVNTHDGNYIFSLNEPNLKQKIKEFYDRN